MAIYKSSFNKKPEKKEKVNRISKKKYRESKDIEIHIK